MKTMLIAFESPEAFAARTTPDETKRNAYWGAWMAYSKAMNDITLDGLALQGPETATRVKVRNGERIVEDGPFADSKEQLGGYFIIDTPDMETALDWAAKCPAAEDALVEARAVPDYGQNQD
ncbi:MAG: YciI family protein [Pseudomonadota bacterium]